MPKQQKVVYLAGFISTDHPETFTWRQEAWQRLLAMFPLDQADFEVLSPLRGKENLGSVTKDGGITTTKNTSRDIILRDFHDVKRSDVILVNLENYGSTRPLLGTIYELAWAWIFDLPVVAICSKDNYLMRNHPFVIETVGHYFETTKEACDFVAEYYR
jgi:nucleoside 2-deoxyribosyltransferase